MIKYCFFLIFFLSSIVMISQIKTRDNIKTKPRDNSTASVYDSITDFRKQSTNVDYLKYVGQELFLPPLSSKQGNGVEIEIMSNLKLQTYESYEFIPDTVYLKNSLKGSYKEFYEKKIENINSEIENHKVKTNIYNPYISIILENTYSSSTNIELDKDNFNKKYEIIGISTENNQNVRNSSKKLNTIRIWLKTKTNDTIYFDKHLQFANESLYPFIVDGFYKYHLKNYTNKTLFVFKEDDNELYGKPKEQYVDINTGELITLQLGDLWECKDIVFIEKSNVTLRPFYILKKNNNEIKVRLGELFNSGFITLQKMDYLYNSWLLEKEKEKIKKNIENRLQNCEERFGKASCLKLMNNQIDIGMTKEMVLFAFGEPYKSYRLKTSKGFKEVYTYGGTILYFRDGQIFAIEEYQY